MENSIDIPEIITLCGSTKFKDIFLEVSKKLTIGRKIVLMPGFFGHSDTEKPNDKLKKRLDELHFKKIDLSSSIFVIDVGGYIEHSTKNEIAYAMNHGKNVFCYSREIEVIAK